MVAVGRGVFVGVACVVLVGVLLGYSVMVGVIVATGVAVSIVGVMVGEGNTVWVVVG